MRDKQDIDGFVGSRIKYIRKLRGYTQEMLADYVGLTRTSIVNIEHGRQSCTAVNLYNIACALDVGFAVFFPNREKVEVEMVNVSKPVKLKIKKSFVKHIISC